MTALEVPSGSWVGGYRLLAEIGSGGMGVVHLAEDAAGRRVAVKVLRPHVVGDEETRHRLEREVASMRQVRSRHVAEIHDADPWAPTPYLVTRYVPGLPLSAHVEHQGPVPEGELLRVARELLLGLRDVHAAGVLHRDVKPSNVLMEGRAPVLIDFGLARMAEDPRLTAHGWLLGSPGYVAPEVLWGQDATTASDVHAWAATIAYAATGRPPYGRGHTLAVLDRTRRGEVDLDGVPPRLRAVLAAGLAGDPRSRPTVAQAIAELERLSAVVGPADARTAPAAGASGEPSSTMPWQAAVRPVTPPRTPTRPYTVVAPAVRPAGPGTGRPATPPAVPLPGGVAPWSPAARRTAVSGPAQLRERLLLGGLLLLVAVGFLADARATVWSVGAAAVALRGAARAEDHAWMRRLRRGGRRWYDDAVTVLSYPWHALCAVPGTAVLLLAAALAAACTVVVAALLGATVGQAGFAGGLVLGVTAWTGPASRRLRRPVQRAVAASARRARTGWPAVAVVAVLAFWVGLQAAGTGNTALDGLPWAELRRTLSR